jgi:hypothetical protein
VRRFVVLTTLTLALSLRERGQIEIAYVLSSLSWGRGPG